MGGEVGGGGGGVCVVYGMFCGVGVCGCERMSCIKGFSDKGVDL